MTSASWELQKAVFAALPATSALPRCSADHGSTTTCRAGRRFPT